MDFSLTPKTEQLRKRVSDFMDQYVFPIEKDVQRVMGESGNTEPDSLKDVRKKAKAEGLWNLFLPDEKFGAGLKNYEYAPLCELMGRSPIGARAFNCMAPDTGNMEILAEFGTPEQKKQWLQKCIDGEIRTCFSMTEPDTPGSDPTQLRTRAVRDGDEYVINGHKWFSSNGSIADFLIVMAVTDPDARAHQRASMFIVDSDTPGVEIVRDVATMEHPQEEFGKLGGHAEILYKDVRVPAANRLGAEGEGFLIAQRRLYPGRIHHCMRWLGVARRAFDILCERATYRQVHGGVLGEQQTVQNWIADSAAQMSAARLMTLHAAWKMDTQGASAARQEISLIKFYGASV